MVLPKDSFNCLPYLMNEQLRMEECASDEFSISFNKLWMVDIEEKDYI